MAVRSERDIKRGHVGLARLGVLESRVRVDSPPEGLLPRRVVGRSEGALVGVSTSTAEGVGIRSKASSWLLEIEVLVEMEAEGEVELKELCRLEGHTDRVWSLAWNPAAGGDGAPAVLASCSGDKTVRIWRQNLAADSWDCTVRFLLISLPLPDPKHAHRLTTNDYGNLVRCDIQFLRPCDKYLFSVSNFDDLKLYFYLFFLSKCCKDVLSSYFCGTAKL